MSECIDNELWEEPKITEMTKIIDRLYLGDFIDSCNEERLAKAGVTHVINVCPEKSYAPKFYGVAYYYIDLIDSNGADLMKAIRQTLPVIDKILDDPRNTLLIHCALGISRSVALAAAYLMYSREMSSSDALEFIQFRRHIAGPNFGFITTLRQFDEILRKKHYHKCKCDVAFIEEQL